MKLKNKRVIIPLVVLGILLLALLSFSAYQLFVSRNSDHLKYSYLAKRVQTQTPNEILINFKDLRQQYYDYLNGLGTQAAEGVSLYFEYQPSGVEISINEDNQYAAASLMKIPYVMDTYKAAEQNKLDLDKKVALKPEWLNDSYGTLYEKGAGYQISIRDAARLALKDSDNTAILLLQDEVRQANLALGDRALNYVDLNYDNAGDGSVRLGPRSYTSILKCVYYSCFNNKEHSQEMLGYLTESSFNNRLTAKLPNSLKVAHKIGSYSTEYQSDCGIFYVDKRNYTLCVMVKGSDPSASEIIANLSAITYSYVEQNKK